MIDTSRVSANGAGSPSPDATEPVANSKRESAVHDLPDIVQEFLKEEHKQRRQEISSVGARMEADNRNVLILTGVIWSWLAANHATLAGQGYFVHVVVSMPAALVAFSSTAGGGCTGPSTRTRSTSANSKPLTGWWMGGWWTCDQKRSPIETLVPD